MNHFQKLILLLLLAIIIVVLICNIIWEIPSKWQFFITFLSFIVAAVSVYLASVQLKENRDQEQKARNESLLQIKESLKTELKRNLQLLNTEQYKIWVESPNDKNGSIVILINPLKTSTFDLISGREDLKYLNPIEALGIISTAYDYIKDFNNIIELWFKRCIYKEGKVIYPFHDKVDLSPLTSDYLQEYKGNAIQKIEEALKLL
jgi:hypothetical protein